MTHTMGLFVTLRINDTQLIRHSAYTTLSIYDTQDNNTLYLVSLCQVRFIVMLSVFIFSAIVLSVIMQSVVMLSVVMPSVIMLSVVMLNIVAPSNVP